MWSQIGQVMSEKRDNSSNEPIEPPYYEFKKRNIAPKVVDDLLEEVLSDPSLEHAIRYNSKVDCYYGTLKTDHYAIIIKHTLRGDAYTLWVCNLDTHELTRYEENPYSSVQYVPMNVVRNAVIDLDANGRRWEGTLVSDHPYGYEVKYDENGHVEYEGYVYHSMRLGYCIDYYNDIEMVKSKGMYGGNDKYGHEIIYDKKGNVDKDCYWLNNTSLSSSRWLHSHVTNVTSDYVIPSRCVQWLLEVKTLSLSRLVCEIESLCIRYMRKLESVHISGCQCSPEIDLDIESCPLLRSIKLESPTIGGKGILISSLPSLEELVIGNHCCQNETLFDISCILLFLDWTVDLPKLKTVEIGERSFLHYESIRIGGTDYCCISLDCPLLESIRIGAGSFPDNDNSCAYNSEGVLQSLITAAIPCRLAFFKSVFGH